MQADRARWMQDQDGAWLCLRAVYPGQARTACEAVDAGKLYDVTVKQLRKKRSLDANAYCWVLLDKLSAKLGIPKTEVYRSYIKEIGGNSETVCVLEKAAQKLTSGWEHNGIGWQTETFESKIKGCVNVTLYYGSSTYDTAQMSRLIDMIVEDCRQNGIETLTPLEIARLKDNWK